MREIICSVFFFVGYLPVLTAQYDKILNNRHVIWAAEFELDYRFRHSCSDSSGEPEPNEVLWWKNYDATGQLVMPAEEIWVQLLLNAALSGEWPVWSLDGTPRQLALPEIRERLDILDTVTIYDMTSVQQKTVPVVNEPDLSDFTGVRARHLIWYNEQTGNFGLYTSYIAMLRVVYAADQDELGLKSDEPVLETAPFWFRMPDYKPERQPVDIQQKHILWAAQVRTASNSPKMSDGIIFKDYKPPVIQQLLNRFRYDPDYKTFDAQGQPINHASKEAMVVHFDTIATFDPETYEEQIVFERNEVDGLDLKALKMTQIWGWDDRKKRLFIRLTSFAPMFENMDSEGNFRFWQTFFVRRLK